MVLPLGRRITSLFAATGLAACAGGPSDGGQQASVDPSPTTMMLVSRTSPTLALHTPGASPPPPPNDNTIAQKVVDPEGMAALVATFESEGLFAHTVPAMPRNARQSLVLERDGARSVWVWVPNARDPRTIAFIQARSFYLQLFNHARNYVPGEDGAADDIESAARRASGARRRP